MFWAWIFMILGFCITSTRPQVFNISRPTSGVDTFKILPAMCNDSRIGCSLFSAAGPSCSCSCAATHSTFTFVNNRWQCMANTGARNHFQRGCGATTTFSGERQNGSIPTLVIGGRREIALHWANFQSIVTCSLNLRSSWFVGCNGSQRLLTNEHYNAAVMMFSIIKRFASSRYILQVNTSVLNSNLLQGRVINVVMDCAARWFGTSVVNIQTCLVFKLAGTETCPESVLSLEMSSTTKPQQTTFTPETFVTSLMTTAFPSNISITTNIENATIRLPLGSDGSSSVDLIAGSSIAGSIALFIFVILGSLVYRRRYLHKTCNESTCTARIKENKQDILTMNPQTNSSTPRDDENEYQALNIGVIEQQIYAPSYSVPQRRVAKDDGPNYANMYASLNITKEHNIYGHRNAQEPEAPACL